MSICCATLCSFVVLVIVAASFGQRPFSTRSLSALDVGLIGVGVVVVGGTLAVMVTIAWPCGADGADGADGVTEGKKIEEA